MKYIGYTSLVWILIFLGDRYFFLNEDEKILSAIKDIKSVSKSIIKRNGVGRECTLSFPKTTERFGRHIFSNGKLVIKYIPSKAIVTGIYRFRGEGNYDAELRITEHLETGMDYEFDCNYAVFRKDENIPIGGATHYIIN